MQTSLDREMIRAISELDDELYNEKVRVDSSRGKESTSRTRKCYNEKNNRLTKNKYFNSFVGRCVV